MIINKYNKKKLETFNTLKGKKTQNEQGIQHNSEKDFNSGNAVQNKMVMVDMLM